MWAVKWQGGRDVEGRVQHDAMSFTQPTVRDRCRAGWMGGMPPPTARTEPRRVAVGGGAGAGAAEGTGGSRLGLIVCFSSGSRVLRAGRNDAVGEALSIASARARIDDWRRPSVISAGRSAGARAEYEPSERWRSALALSGSGTELLLSGTVAVRRTGVCMAGARPGRGAG